MGLILLVSLTIFLSSILRGEALLAKHHSKEIDGGRGQNYINFSDPCQLHLPHPVPILAKTQNVGSSETQGEHLGKANLLWEEGQTS